MTLLTFFYVLGIVFGAIFLFLNISIFFGGDMDGDTDGMDGMDGMDGADGDLDDIDGGSGGMFGE